MNALISGTIVWLYGICVCKLSTVHPSSQQKVCTHTCKHVLESQVLSITV